MGLRPSHQASERGFTLMETLVAFVVFASVIIALQQAMALGWRAIRLTQMEQSALSLARSKLAAVGVESAITDEADETGIENGMAWHTLARRYKAPDAIVFAGGVSAYWVTVTVSWRDRPVGPARSVELVTLKRGSQL